MSALTSDNSHLSSPTNGADSPLDQGFAIDCTRAPLETFLRESIAPNTRRAYASDLDRFSQWGGELPATSETIARYISLHADSHAVSTLVRWLSSLAKAHRAAGYADPTKSEIVRSVLRGIRRVRGSAQKQAKPLLREDLFLILDAIGSRPKDVRDKALLLTGFAGGFRRSELVGLDFADLEPVRQGRIVTIRRSKTDQSGKGRQIGIPYGRGRYCPMSALEDWLSSSGISSGPVFRPVDRHGHIGAQRLSGGAVSSILRQRLEEARLDPDGYSGHSLRAGFATSAAQAGVSSLKIREQTGHASEAMLSRYIRAGELFTDNAAGALL